MSERARSFHQIAIDIPADWPDETLFRFALPPKPDASGAPRRFRTNIIVSKHKAKPGTPVDDAFADVTKKEPGSAPAGQGQGGPGPSAPPDRSVLGSGIGTMSGQRAAWVDVSFAAPPVGTLYQRQIAVMPAPASLVVFTLTSDDANLDAITGQLGFSTAS